MPPPPNELHVGLQLVRDRRDFGLLFLGEFQFARHLAQRRQAGLRIGPLPHHSASTATTALSQDRLDRHRDEHESDRSRQPFTEIPVHTNAPF